MESKERIAYLKGLLDGLRPQDETQVKVYAAIVDALEALADETEMHAEFSLMRQEMQSLREEIVGLRRSLGETSAKDTIG